MDYQWGGGGGGGQHSCSQTIDHKNYFEKR